MFAIIAAPPAIGVKKLFDRFLHLLTLTDTTLTEFISSTTLLFVGVLLVFPAPALLANIPLFSTMTSFASEGVWSFFFIGLGVFQSIANLTRNLRARRYAAFSAFVFFGFIGFLGASVHPVSLFGAMCKVHGFGQAIVYLQLGVHASQKAK